MRLLFTFYTAGVGQILTRLQKSFLHKDYTYVGTIGILLTRKTVPLILSQSLSFRITLR